jgi:hypothetical protein
MSLKQEDLLRVIGESTREAIYKSTAPLAAEIKAQRQRNTALALEIADIKRASGDASTPAATKCAAPMAWRITIERDGNGDISAMNAIPQA